MKLLVQPSKLAGRIAVPGSKSHTIRAIVAGLAASGVSEVTGALAAADTLSTLEAARKLGAQAEITPERWSITGTGGEFTDPGATLDLGNSGTGLRLLFAMAANASFKTTFDGDFSLRSRVMLPLANALEALGAKVAGEKCPISVTGPLAGGRAVVYAPSSQFLTACLFAAPLASADTTLEVAELNEAPYIGITLKWLERCGIELEAAADYSFFRIPGNQRYRAFNAVIPADFSTAAFPLVAGAIAGNGVEIANLDFSDVQGDKAVFDMIAQMGGSSEISGTSALVSPSKLVGREIDLNATPDALPIMAVAAAAASGETRLVNVPQARIKETDRISVMASELAKMGVKSTELPDGLIIQGTRLRGAADLESHGDHRVAMALAIAALVADAPSQINGVEAASVSYPDFFADFIALGADFKGL